MLYTNEYHHFHYKTFAVDASGPFPVAVTQKGWWYCIDFIYRMFLVFAGLALFAVSYAKASGYRRRQARVMFVGALSFWTGTLFQILGFAPYGVDIEPFILSAALPLYIFAMLRLRMFDLVPIARDKVFKTMSASVIVLDDKLRVVDFNDSAVAILPALSKDAVNLAVRDVFPASNPLDVAALLQHGEMEIALPVAGGLRYYKVSCAMVGAAERDSGLIVSLYDTTESKELLEKMHTIASLDALTQVFSRWYFMDAFKHEIERRKATGGALAFMLLDIDHFKLVNDQYGHMAGDSVLRDVTAALKNTLGDKALLGRYGGEEFSVLLPGAGQEEARSLAERLRQAAARLNTSFGGAAIKVTICVGVAAAVFEPEALQDMESNQVCDALILAADSALYRAKQEGRNRVCAAPLDYEEQGAG